MIRLETSNNAGTLVHEGLNVVGDIAEKPIKPILAVTALILVLDILIKKSPMRTLKLGAAGLVLAGVLKGASIVSDIGVDAISHPEKSS